MICKNGHPVANGLRFCDECGILIVATPECDSPVNNQTTHIDSDSNHLDLPADPQISAGVPAIETERMPDIDLAKSTTPSESNGSITKDSPPLLSRINYKVATAIATAALVGVGTIWAVQSRESSNLVNESPISAVQELPNPQQMVPSMADSEAAEPAITDDAQAVDVHEPTPISTTLSNQPIPDEPEVSNVVNSFPLGGFRSPSRNIKCNLISSSVLDSWIGDELVACTIDEKEWISPFPDQYDGGEPRLGCQREEDPFTVSAAGINQEYCGLMRATLTNIQYEPIIAEYGQRFTTGISVCTVEQTGVACENLISGDGFKLSRAELERW